MRKPRGSALVGSMGDWFPAACHERDLIYGDWLMDEFSLRRWGWNEVDRH